MKTIKEIAGELGVSKQAVRNQIANLGLQSSLQKNGNQFVIDEDQEALIKQGFSEKLKSENANQPQNETETDLRFSLRLLEHELDIKNKLLSEQQQTIRELTSALEKTSASLQAAQALHAGTMQKQLMEPEKPVGFFTRLFSSKG